MPTGSCQTKRTFADNRAIPGRAVMSRATPRLALQAARAGAALRCPSVGGALPFLGGGGRTVADAVRSAEADGAFQPCKVQPCPSDMYGNNRQPTISHSLRTASQRLWRRAKSQSRNCDAYLCRCDCSKSDTSCNFLPRNRQERWSAVYNGLGHTRLPHSRFQEWFVGFTESSQTQGQMGCKVVTNRRTYL